ncbi:MAG TPA: peptidoglycan glycosyltransferase [Thermoanaerobacterales bacterium]|nr:peptidoglycan glycosyltransferase [Thermoanaerobacterales bacterium]
MDKLERNIKLIFGIFCCLFISLIIYLTYFTAVERERLIKSSYNRRLWEQEEKVMRGTIYDRKGKPLAETGIEGDYKKRIYNGGKSIGPIVGYSERTLGRAGLEDVYNGELLGITEKDPMMLLRQKILGVSKRGSDLYLTIDLELQQTAYDMFYNRKGALVALDPKTGQILAMVSSPGFDPSTIQEDWETLSKDEAKPLINRATQGLYPPGSSFKIITLAAALENNPEIENQTYYTPGYIKINGSIIRDSEHLWPGEYDLSTAFRYSSNTVFIQIGQQVEREKMISIVEAFGFNTNIKTDIPVAKSTFPRSSIIVSNVEMAESFIGQGKILSTPLQMAKATAIIANKGKDIKPYVIQKVVSPLGNAIDMKPSVTMTQVVNQQVAEKVKDLMVDVVRNGTGTKAFINNIEVAGKTGSAENPHGIAHAWFVGFAPAEDPKIAVAVVVENAGSGGTHAGPIAREIILKYLSNGG